MQRFVAKQNIQRFQDLPDIEVNGETRAQLEIPLAEARRELN